MDFKLQEAKTSGGTYQDIAGTAITQVTVSNKIVTVEVRSDQLAASVKRRPGQSGHRPLDAERG